MTSTPLPLTLHEELVRRFGSHSTAFQTLSPGFSLWRCDDAAGVAYVDTGRAWVAAGPPLAAAARQNAVAQAFVVAARQRRRRPVFFAAPADLLGAAGASLHVGQEPFWQPHLWPDFVQTHANLRQQLRRARNKGVTVRALDPALLVAADSPLRQQIHALMQRWSSHKAMPPMGFLVDLNPFVHVHARRYWLAEVVDPHNQASRAYPVGFVALTPFYGEGDAHESWLVEHLLRDPAAPNGCAESLVHAAMMALAISPQLSLGMVPLRQVRSPLLRTVGWLTDGLYHFRGLARFKSKLRPQTWQTVYIVFPRHRLRLVALYDVLGAFAPQGLARFAWGVLGRGSPVLIRALSWILVPWTAALASMEGDVWFPNKALQHFWTGFDLLLAGALFLLGRRWRQGLATFLASLITADAVATALEAVLYRQPEGFAADCVRALAVVAPTLTAILLWRARAYRSRL